MPAPHTEQPPSGMAGQGLGGDVGAGTVVGSVGAVGVGSVGAVG